MGTLMGRKSKALTALDVKRLVEPGMHFVGEVPGLALQVHSETSRSWVLRVMVGGKRRDHGLGGYPAVTLADAKTAAREARERIKRGIDPIEEKRGERARLAAQQARAMTFDACAKAYIAAHAPSWSNSKHIDQWRNTLEAYASPVIGAVDVGAVDQAMVLRILEPIWSTKTETATRLRGRIESILDWATVREYRTGENPARWRGRLDKLLAKPSKVRKAKHHAALPYAQLGAFMKRLRDVEGLGARALEFAILTAARSGEVRGARRSEIDREGRLWTIPAGRMKAGREHRVPLSEQAVALLEALPELDADLLFPGRTSGMLSDMTLSAVLRRLKVDATVHGFRSTFRDWAAEQTNFPNEVAEMALAHTVSDKVEAAYRRGDLFVKRQKMMESWAGYVDTVQSDRKVIVGNFGRVA